MSHELPVDTGETCQSLKVLLSKMLPRSKPPWTHLTLPFWGEVRLDGQLKVTQSFEKRVIQKAGICKFPCLPVCQQQQTDNCTWATDGNSYSHIQKTPYRIFYLVREKCGQRALVHLSTGVKHIGWTFKETRTFWPISKSLGK